LQVIKPKELVRTCTDVSLATESDHLEQRVSAERPCVAGSPTCEDSSSEEHTSASTRRWRAVILTLEIRTASAEAAISGSVCQCSRPILAVRFSQANKAACCCASAHLTPRSLLGSAGLTRMNWILARRFPWRGEARKDSAVPPRHKGSYCGHRHWTPASGFWRAGTGNGCGLYGWTRVRPQVTGHRTSPGPFLVASTVRGSPNGGNRAESTINWNTRVSRHFELP
jgi:hypothetical protein